MSIRPLQDRVVVRRTEEETKSAGGIVIPDSAAEKPSQGEVIAVGPGKKLDNGSIQSVDLKSGDKILFGQYSGSTVKIDGEELHSQVLADFSVDEIHKLVYSLGFNRKSDEQLAEETQQNLKQVRPKIKNPVFSPLI